MNAQLGAMHAASFGTDPKHLGFVLARYKFVAKMLHGLGHVLEVGCGDKTGATIVRRYVDRWEGIDLDTGHNIVEAPYGDALDPWDAVYALDVLEHISPEYEYRALYNMRRHLREHGVCIIGTPSLESQKWASELSLRHHVNCKTEDNLRDVMLQQFHNVFLFGMNDETLHTGFGPMCHYRIAMGVGPR